MEILILVSLGISVYAFMVARNAHKRLDMYKNATSLEAEAIWEILISKGLVEKADFDFAMKIAHDKLDSLK